MYQDGYISTEHQLIGITEGSSNAKELLAKYGVTTDSVRTALKSVRGSQSVTDQNPEGKYQSLEKYGRDLTTAAENGKLDPVIGRDEEIRRVIHVLSRRTKNNPVLIGEPGIGKTAIDDKRLIRFPTLIAGLFRTDSFSPGVRTRRNSDPASRATFRRNLLTYFQSGSAENI